MDTLAFNLDVRLNSLFYKGDDERVTICFADFHRFSATALRIFIDFPQQRYNYLLKHTSFLISYLVLGWTLKKEGTEKVSSLRTVPSIIYFKIILYVHYTNITYRQPLPLPAILASLRSVCTHTRLRVPPNGEPPPPAFRQG